MNKTTRNIGITSIIVFAIAAVIYINQPTVINCTGGTSAGYKIENTSNVTIRNCKITDEFIGIELINAQDITLENLEICTTHPESSGIDLHNVDGLVVRDVFTHSCGANKHGWGISGTDVSNAQFINVLITDTGQLGGGGKHSVYMDNWKNFSFTNFECRRAWNSCFKIIGADTFNGTFDGIKAVDIGESNVYGSVFMICDGRPCSVHDLTIKNVTITNALEGAMEIYGAAGSVKNLTINGILIANPAPMFSLPTAPIVPLVFQGGFEDGIIHQYPNAVNNFRDQQQEVPGRLLAQTTTVRSGVYALRVQVNPGDQYKETSGWRSELYAPYGADGKEVIENEMSGTRYYAISVYLPLDYVTPTDPKAWGTIFQLHGDTVYKAPPSFSLNVIDAYSISIRAGDLDALVAPKDPTKTHVMKYNLGSLQRGKWVDFVIMLRHAKDKTGAVEAWRRVEGEVGFTKVLDAQNIPTLMYKSSVQGGAVLKHYWKTGYYRDTLDRILNGVNVPTILYLDSHTIGTTFDSVVNAAWGDAVVVPTPTSTPTRTATKTSTGSPTAIPPSVTPSLTATPSLTPTSSLTFSPVAPTATRTPTKTPTFTPSPTSTPIPSADLCVKITWNKMFTTQDLSIRPSASLSNLADGSYEFGKVIPIEAVVTNSSGVWAQINRGQFIAMKLSNEITYSILTPCP